ncbi:MAG: serine/threonine protein kinase/WD40 repeat protein [Paracoccaceae bacterium]|jgi:serine/threonine protein kinase/WD40 repeat protein
MAEERSEREIFAAAFECKDLKEREKLLERECGTDMTLRDAVETLLDEYSGLGDFLENPAMGGLRILPGVSENLIGKKLGPFTLIEQIGEGGGGSVYLAEQILPVQRQVALKILKLGMDTTRVIARFEAERQTLARMEHPHIASVIDAGATNEGRPYFVMEYVAGDPVTEYCDKRKLPIEERLEIFIRICRAIEHAHQKGVIHRDLKPSNILVREQEGRAVPKVIDFGVAKAIDPLDGDLGGFTINDTIIGTPAYMSPEQASQGIRDIDTRADVYSLGVILYELLTGSTPLRATTSGMSHPPEVLKILGEIDPPRPSTFLRNQRTEVRERVGSQRKMATGRLISELQGDLDWIAMRCLDKDRARRFGSASELGRDLEFYLKGAPITARPPSWRYRSRKFVDRNRVAVASAGLLLATLIAAAVVSFVFGVRATKAEAMESTLRIEAERDRELALNSAEKARLHQYVANINLAQQALQDGHVSKALLLLEPWASVKPGEIDLRGFEWRFLMEKCLGDEHFDLPRFDGPIDALAFSPNGNLLAIAAMNRVHLWSLDQKKITSTFPHDTKSLEFSHGGKRLLVNGRYGVVVLDVPSGDSIWELEGGSHEAATSPDGRFLATSDRQGITVWNTSTWKSEQFFPGSSGSLTFSPNGNILATAGRDGVTLWPLEEEASPIVLEESPRFRFGGNNIHFSRDGKLVLLARNENPTDSGFAIGLWEAESGKEIAMLPESAEGGLHTGVISAMDFNRDGSLLASSSWDHSVRLWDFAKGSLLRTFLGHRGEVWSVSMSPDGDFVASGSKDGKVKIWPTDESTRHDSIDGHWTSLGFSRDSKTIAVLDGEGTFVTFDIALGKKIHTQAFSKSRTNRHRDVSANRNLDKLAEEQGDGIVIIRDLKSQTETILEVGMRQIDSLSLSPDGKTLVVTSRREGMSWWDLADSDKPILQSKASLAHFSADGSTLIVSHDNGSLVVWDTVTRKERSHLKIEPTSSGTRMALSRDGSLLAVTHGFQDYENAITLWDTVSSKEVGTLKGHKQGIWSIAFSPDGRTLASSGGGGIVRLWNIATQSELLTIRELGTAMTHLTFSPDGKVLMTSSPSFLSDPKIRFFRSSVKDR